MPYFFWIKLSIMPVKISEWQLLTQLPSSYKNQTVRLWFKWTLHFKLCIKQLHYLKVVKYEIQNPQIVVQHCLFASFGSMFRVFHLACSTCRATKTFIVGWRHAVRWLVDLLGVNPRQVASLMKIEQKSQNLLLKEDPNLQQNNVRQVEGFCTLYFAALRCWLILVWLCIQQVSG